MIAAPEPQELIPSGRQLINDHPDLIKNIKPLVQSEEIAHDAILNQLKYVCITDEKNLPELWTVRERKYVNSEKKTVDQIIKDYFDIKEKEFEQTSENETRNEKKLSKRRIKSKVLQAEKDSKTNSLNSITILNDPPCSSTAENLPIFVLEDEVFVKGNIAIWLKKIKLKHNNNQKYYSNICSLSMKLPIKQVLVTQFYIERPSVIGVNGEFGPPSKKTVLGSFDCICLLDEFNIHTFSDDKENFVTTFPFLRSNTWSMEFGLLVERDLSIYNKMNHTLIELEALSIIYSLTHPLNSFCPVTIKTSTIQLFSNSSLKIIFTCREPSVCLIYDSSLGCHCVYKIRKITDDELLELSESKLKLCNTIPSLTKVSNKVKDNLSVWSGNGAGLPLNNSHQFNRAECLSALFNQSCHQPPSLGRCFSSSSPFYENSTKHSPYGHTEDYNTQSKGHFDADGVNMPPRQATPEICFEHLWTESLNAIKLSSTGANGAATKAFFASDLVGYKYLCYLIQSSKLILVRIEMSNDNNFIFGPMSHLNAKDAINIDSLHMIATLDLQGHVMLYSGITLIGKLHVGGVAAEFTPSIATNVAIPLLNIKSPFPRRSSLLPHCATTNANLHIDESILSPVHPAMFLKGNMLNSTLLHDAIPSSSKSCIITGFKDPIERRFTIQYSDNTHLRVTLPPLANHSLTQSCLDVLRNSLQKDVAMFVFAKWYASRNCPGSFNDTINNEWQLFSSLLFSLLGYNVEKLRPSSCDSSGNEIESKRQRPTPKGSNESWRQLCTSNYHKDSAHDLKYMLKLQKTTLISITQNTEKGYINNSAPLFAYFRLIFFSLHLLYEDLKLSNRRLCDLPLLANFLQQLAFDLKLQNYVTYYWKDFPQSCFLSHCSVEASCITDSDFLKLQPLMTLDSEPICFMKCYYNLLNGYNFRPYPYLKNVNNCSRFILQACGIVVAGRQQTSYNSDLLIKHFVPPGRRAEAFNSGDFLRLLYQKWSWSEKFIMFITENGINRTKIENFPPVIHLFFYEILWYCRENPPTDWLADTYYLLQRPELVYQAKQYDIKKCKNTCVMPIRQLLPTVNKMNVNGDDGMDNIDSVVLELRFPDDLRIMEVRRLLRSSEPVIINLVQRPEVSDHDFIEEQERHLYAVCIRTMALSVGRGMFTLRTANSIVTDMFPIPKLCLSGKAPPRGNTVELSHIDTPSHMNMWPLFHNGCAAGLRLTPNSCNVDSGWIIYNRPKPSCETPMEHAGFLFALGLNGHLKNLFVLNIYEYLTQYREIVSVGLILGLAASKRGSMDNTLTKILSIHIEALLPPTSIEMDIPQNIQVASLLSIGLLYEGSLHRHITEMLLSEIGRPPGPEMENSTDRESYSLTAGLALGMLTLQKGGNPSGFSDLPLADILHYYMAGGTKQPFTGIQKDKYKIPSFQIREGSYVNLDITAPGATFALGLMFLQSGNQAIAKWMDPPETPFLLEFIRPDLLMYRIIARALILWNDIKPNIEWVENQVPKSIQLSSIEKEKDDSDTSYESLKYQVYCNIVAGGCFALALRYAGTANEDAFNTTFHYCKLFTTTIGKTFIELAGKPTVEASLMLILLSGSIIMAGTGRLEILRLCRYLRKRVGVASSTIVTYGSHLVIHMALGLLFLGGGRYTLSNSPSSIAAMLCAFFPKFPTHSNDNRYHLQAFRHLYVLAAEPRLIIPRNITTKSTTYAYVYIENRNGETFKYQAPCLIPDLNTLVRVVVTDDRYWDVVFERDRNWQHLLAILGSSGVVEIKQRAGCLSYKEDPYGHRSFNGQVIQNFIGFPWIPLYDTMSSFLLDPSIHNLAKNYLDLKKCSTSKVEERLKQANIVATYECIVQDKVVVLHIWRLFNDYVHTLEVAPDAYKMWQLKILFSQLHNSNPIQLIPKDAIVSFKQSIEYCLDKWQTEFSLNLKDFISRGILDMPLTQQLKIVSFITFYEIPFNVNVPVNNNNILQLFIELKSNQCNLKTIQKVFEIMSCK